jgi:hypothetical protein
VFSPFDCDNNTVTARCDLRPKAIREHLRSQIAAWCCCQTTDRCPGAVQGGSPAGPPAPAPAALGTAQAPWLQPQRRAAPRTPMASGSHRRGSAQRSWPSARDVVTKSGTHPWVVWGTGRHLGLSTAGGYALHRPDGGIHRMTYGQMIANTRTHTQCVQLHLDCYNRAVLAWHCIKQTCSIFAGHHDARTDLGHLRDC